jgi:hypothetical protein
MYPYESAAANANGHDRSVRKLRIHQKNVATIAVTATDSLSKPPATLRMMCAGRIAMMNAVTANAVALCFPTAASFAMSAVNSVAMTEKPAGMNTHTSFRLTSKPNALSARKIPAAVNCIPG